MLEISQIAIPLDAAVGSRACLAASARAAAKALGLAPCDVAGVELRRRSIDARRRRDVHIIVSVRVRVRGGIDEATLAARADGTKTPCIRIVADEPATSRAREARDGWKTWAARVMGGATARTAQAAVRAHDAAVSAAPRVARTLGATRPIVVGAGCAGLFAALALAEAGLEPLVIERGEGAAARADAIRRFYRTGALDTSSNIQFGLGGAGTFSDGKLSTGTRGPAHRLILETLAAAGAPREILWDAKPHIGSDLLPGIVERIAARIRELGGEVRFGCRLVDIAYAGGSGDRTIRAIEVEGCEGGRIACGQLILACGHSARDVFELLRDRGLCLERKTFAMGVRIEHLQGEIDRALFGRAAGHPALGAGSYRLAVHAADGRSVFTFCMCPGGEVVAAASEEGGVVTNGASRSDRAGENANAALLANITPDDLPGDDPLAGIALQRRCEQAAFELGGGSFRAPAQLVGDFLAGSPSEEAGRVRPTYRLGVRWGRIDRALPDCIAGALRPGLVQLGRRLSGFDAADAVLTGVETRSSSPVRVGRDASLQAVGVTGVFPCGEGAGYAGGIMSAAADGIRCAEGLIASLR